MNISKNRGIIKSWLDNDCYNANQAFFFWIKWKNAVGRYAYKCRSKGVDLSILLEALKRELQHMHDLEFTKEDAKKLCRNTRVTMAFAMSLVGKRILDIHQVKVLINKKGDLVLNYEGPIWLRILVETPLLATISELYFRHTMSEEKYAEAHQAGLQWITETAQKMASFPEGFGVTEGGTRRRFSVAHYENVLKALKEHSGGKLKATSNIYYGDLYGIPVVGTMAHQLQMFYQAVTTVQDSVAASLRDWVEVFEDQREAMGTALTDTLGDRYWSWVFKKENLPSFFHTERHDSGCPFAWGYLRLKQYKQMGVQTVGRSLLFSDSLNLDKALALYNEFSGLINVKIMIGTFLVNTIPVDGHEALSQVIKLVWANAEGDYENMQPLVKLSADMAKSQGECETHNAHAIWVAENCPDVFAEAA